MDAAADRHQAAFPKFHFIGTWRSYQARVLHELEDHLDDARLNIVAAPGAGKTVLGLEVLRRLGRPALVLSPSRAIRDQWLQRLEELFEAESGAWPGGIGSDLSAPGWLTSVTYQALHTALRGLLEPEDEDDEGEGSGEEEDDDAPAAATSAAAAGEALLAALEAAGIETLVLDEAHHLRRAWWESLQEVIGHLRARRKNFHVVSLTATPPYDVEQEEWNRYEEVCGPIDAEISIPELVKQGDLCPHQDFLHFNVARGAAFESLEAFAREAASVAMTWAQDPEVIGWIESHPWIADPQGHEARILARPAAFCGLLSVLKANGRPLPPAGPAVLCLTDEAVPAAEPKALRGAVSGNPRRRSALRQSRHRAAPEAGPAVHRGAVARPGAPAQAAGPCPRPGRHRRQARQHRGDCPAPSSQRWASGCASSSSPTTCAPRPCRARRTAPATAWGPGRSCAAWGRPAWRPNCARR